MGSPHVYGANDAELFRGLAAQMESHGNLLLKLYGRARGRAAEYWGEKHLAEDRYVRTMGIPSVPLRGTPRRILRFGPTSTRSRTG